LKFNSKTIKTNWMSVISKFSRNTIIGLVIIALLSFLVTSPIITKPAYQSETLIFVPLIILSKQIEQQGIGFASDREIDAHIQILESGQLKDSLIERFDLGASFGVDTDELGGRNQLHRMIDSRIKIQKTRFSSLSIKVKDQDPAQAAIIANAIVDLGNVIKEAVLYANRQGAEAYARNLYESKLLDIQSLERQMDSIVDLGGDLIAQSELTKLQTLYSSNLQELVGRKNHWEREQKSLQTKLPKAYVISTAIADTNPVSPNRKLIVIASVLIYLFACAVFFIVTRDIKLVYEKD
jgi:capsular polysaccharide biosynthesis protein